MGAPLKSSLRQQNHLNCSAELPKLRGRRYALAYVGLTVVRLPPCCSAGHQLASGPPWAPHLYLTNHTVTRSKATPEKSDNASFASSEHSIAVESSGTGRVERESVPRNIGETVGNTTQTAATAGGSSGQGIVVESGGAEFAADSGGGSSSGRARTQSDFAADVSRCEDFACLRTAHAAGTGGPRFNFPHFMIVGWQKCATTSLFK